MSKFFIDRLRCLAERPWIGDEMARTLKKAADTIENQQKELHETKSELQRVIAELHEVESDRDAMLKILEEQADCELCKHDATPLPCSEEVDAEHGCGEACPYEKIVCCGCKGKRWEWRGSEVK